MLVILLVRMKFSFVVQIVYSLSYFYIYYCIGLSIKFSIAVTLDLYFGRVA